jgi:tRNA-uridine 2-sulfurtransferase
MGKSVLVAISGGLDSAITSMLLKKRGYNVYGIHFNLYNKADENEISTISENLQIPIVELNLHHEFKSTVINYFTTEYTLGRTPCPCSFCNVNIKFNVLYNYALENNIDFIATGHYVRQTEENSVPRFMRGIDSAKDQSFFLWGVDPKFISKTITPLGELTKTEVRKIAKENGLGIVASKKESMGICFLKGNDYREFIKQSSITTKDEGDVLDENGNWISKHNGIHNYTVGQKKGLNGVPKDYCVTSINSKDNTITVGKWDSLFRNVLTLRDCKFPTLSVGSHDGITLMVRGFGKNPNGYSTLNLLENNSAVVSLTDPAWAPMPGQPVVIYKNEILLGGGYLVNSYLDKKN